MNPGAEPPADAVPIACTLDAGSLAERATEWSEFVASWVVSVEPIALGPDHRTLVLRVPEGAEEALAGFVAMLQG